MEEHLKSGYIWLEDASAYIAHEEFSPSEDEKNIQTANKKIRDAVADGKLKAEIKTRGGYYRDIPKECFGDNNFRFRTKNILQLGLGSGNRVEGLICVEKNGLAKLTCPRIIEPEGLAYTVAADAEKPKIHDLQLVGNVNAIGGKKKRKQTTQFMKIRDCAKEVQQELGVNGEPSKKKELWGLVASKYMEKYQTKIGDKNAGNLAVHSSGDWDEFGWVIKKRRVNKRTKYS